MNKRITLTEEDRELIKVALESLHKESIINPSIFPKYAIASRQRIDQIIMKFDL